MNQIDFTQVRESLFRFEEECTCDRLLIGVIGYSMRITDQHVIPAIKVAEHEGNKNSCEYNRSRSIIQVADGNRYIILPMDPFRIRGLHLDQILICDDYRWDVFEKCSELIKVATEGLSNKVPEEYQIIKLQLFNDPEKQGFDVCIFCQGYIPEGRHICEKCEKEHLHEPVPPMP